MALGSEGPHSDVDLMVLGELGFGDAVNALYDSQAMLGREVNPKVMTLSEWHSRKAAGDGFVQDLLSKPRLLLMGAQDEL
jgi:hypothetical protein